MRECCEIAAAVPERQRAVLRAVLWVNGAMLLMELSAGLLAHSTSLIADSVDMLGDAIAYGFSLYVVARGPAWQARAALLKGVIMAAFGAGLLAEAAAKLALNVLPAAHVMSGVGVVALGANLVCLALLRRHRGDDINMQSAWLCSRNDVVANGAVLIAGAGVWVTGAAWPDIGVGLLIAGMFGTSAIDVIRRARVQRRAVSAA